MKIDKVRIGLVGLGLVSHSHIKAYQSHPDAEVIAVCDLDGDRAKKVAGQYGIPKYYTSYDEMLTNPDINLIDITTPTFKHTSMTLAAAKAKKNILCEKPFCLTLKEGKNAYEEAEKNGVRLMVGESYVFMTSMKKARALIDAGEIGKPQQIRQRFGAWVERPGVLAARQDSIDSSWRLDSATAGGSGFPWMYDHCVHFFSTAEYLMNDSPIKEVYSVMANNSWKPEEGQGRMHHYNTGATQDIPIMTWKHEDPACQGVWMRAEFLNGKYDPMTGFSVSVIGDKGMIEVLGEGGGGLQWQGKNEHLVLHRKGKDTLTFRFDEGGDDIWQSEVSYYSRAHTNQIHEYIDSLVAGLPPRYSGVDGYRAVKTTMAAIASALEDVPVQVADMTDERAKKK